MYCLLEITSRKEYIPHWMETQQYKNICTILDKSEDVREIVELFSFFEEAIDDLKNWSTNAENYGEYLNRNRHTAERLCRGVLLELTACLDQIEHLLDTKYGQESEVYKLFDTKKEEKKTCKEFAFALKLRNYAHHCDEIVHSFIAGKQQGYMQPCCIQSKLIEGFDEWNKKEKRFINRQIGNIDLIVIFEKVYDSLDSIKNVLVDKLLECDDLKSDMLRLRKWMDNSFSKEKSSCFYLSQMKLLNGKDAPKMAFYSKKIRYTFESRTIDWMIAYRISDYILQSWEEGV